MRKKYITFFILSFIFLYFFAVFDVNFHGPDEPVYFAYTASVVEDSDLNVVNQVYYSFGRLVSKTYNSPDYHNYGGIILWIPFYAYAKFMYFLAVKLNLSNLTFYSFEQLAKCAMSFSTVVLGFIIIVLTFNFCKRFYSEKNAIWSTLAIFLGTPFFYYMLFEVGNANIIGCLFSLLSILFCFQLINSERLHWFLYGLFFSICVLVRVELLLQIFFIFFYFATLLLLKQITWKKGLYFLLGFVAIFVLRSINAYIKYGSLHIEELLYITSFLRYKSTYIFNGLFSSFRGIFYTSPVFYICLLGVAFLVRGALKNTKKENLKKNPQDIFLLILSLYLVLKLVLIGAIFSPAGDSLSARLLITEFPVFVLLFAKAIQNLKRYLKSFILVISSFFVIWNFLLISEYVAGFDWIYITKVPVIHMRINAIRYILNSLFYVKKLDIKLSLCLILLLVALIVFFYIIKKISQQGYFFPRQTSDKNNYNYLRALAPFTIYSCTIYLLITLLNVFNNKINVEELKKDGFFESARVIEALPMKLTEWEEEEHLWTLFKMVGYYALKGDVKMASKIKNLRETIFNKRGRSRLHSLPIRDYDNLLDCYNTSERYAAAIQCYRELIRLDPDDFEAYIGLGDIYMGIGEYNQAIESYEKGAELIPNNNLIYVMLGEIYYFRAKKYEKAIEYMKKAIQLNPDSANAYVNLGHIYKTKGNYEKAIEYYRQTIKLNPSFVADAYVNLGYIYNTNSDYEKAIEYFKKTIRIDPDFADAYVSLGHIYNTKGDYEKAIGYYQQTIKLDPDFADAYVSLGHIYRTKGDTKNVLRQVSELKKLKRDDLANELEQSIENNVND